MAAPCQTRLATFELFGLLFGLSACILMKIHNTQPTPYMDEIFHHRQTVKYCEGKFMEWDPMITTLPGLYAVTVSTMNVVSLFFDYDLFVLCDLFWMRCVNLAFCMGNAALVMLLYKHLHPVQTDLLQEKWRLIFNTFATAIFPPLYFFTFLYYTDAGSTFFVLLLYYSSKRQRHKSAALCGLLAVLFRQTNIIWVAFVAGENVANILIERIRPEKKDITEEEVRSLSFVPVVLRNLLSDLTSFSRLRTLVSAILSSCYAYLLIGISFAVFVFWNDGIVVGDRSSHKACLHLPQLLYFTAFTAGFTWMYHVTFPKIVRFSKSLLKHPIFFVFTIAAMFVFVKFFTYEHPYLLADNRHYTFYIWARIFKRHEMVRFALIPCYYYAAFCLTDSLSHKDILWKLVFTICLVAATVPQKLLEFRYFIIPFLLFRLNMRLGSTFQILLEACLYIAVNGFTIYYFVEKTFTWPNAAGQQRFMW